MSSYKGSTHSSFVTACVSEGDLSNAAHRRVRKKGQPRHALNVAPEPRFNSGLSPFSTPEVESLIPKVNFPLVAGKTVALVEQSLNLEAQRHEYRSQFARQPTDQMVIKAMKKLARCARALQAELPLLPSSRDNNLSRPSIAPAHGLVWPLRLHLPETMAYRLSQGRAIPVRTPQPDELWITKEEAGEKQQLMGAYMSERYLRYLSEFSGALAEACDMAVEDAEQYSEETTNSTETITTLKGTVRALLALYSEIFGRKATISKDGVTSRPKGPALRFVQGALKVMGVETSDENIRRLSRQSS